MTSRQLLCEHHLRLVIHAALDQPNPTKDLVDALQVALAGLESRYRLRPKAPEPEERERPRSAYWQVGLGR